MGRAFSRILTTFSLSAACLQSHNVSATWLNLNNFSLKINLEFGYWELTKKMVQIGQELDFLEVSFSLNSFE